MTGRVRPNQSTQKTSLQLFLLHRRETLRTCTHRLRVVSLLRLPAWPRSRHVVFAGHTRWRVVRLCICVAKVKQVVVICWRQEPVSVGHRANRQHMGLFVVDVVGPSTLSVSLSPSSVSLSSLSTSGHRTTDPMRSVPRLYRHPEAAHNVRRTGLGRCGLRRRGESDTQSVGSTGRAGLDTKLDPIVASVQTSDPMGRATTRTICCLCGCGERADRH